MSLHGAQPLQRKLLGKEMGPLEKPEGGGNKLPLAKYNLSERNDQLYSF